MSIDPNLDPAVEPAAPIPPQKRPLGLVGAIILVILALVLVFLLVIKPMFFGDETGGPVMDGPVPPPPGAPVAPGPGAEMPGGMPAPPPESPAPPSAPAHAGYAAANMTPGPDEIVLHGSVRSMGVDGTRFVMSVEAIRMPGKDIQSLTPPRDKVIATSQGVKIQQGGAAAQVNIVTPGAKVSAVGKNLGVGARLPARVIEVEAVSTAPTP